MIETTRYRGVKPRLQGFLSNHESQERVVSITTEPETIYVEEARESNNLSFDFVIEGLTDRKLVVKFIKAAVYDEAGSLVTYRHLNHNGVGTPGIHTIGKYEVNGRETYDIYNPFHSFPKKTPLDRLRYMFTFSEPETGIEYYYGNTVVEPTRYRQKARLTIPVKGLVTILDGHDFYSHHRRFSMTLIRRATDGAFASNFSRFALDFTHLGEDGNTRRMSPADYSSNYDFHFGDVTGFYTHGEDVYAPAGGEVVSVVDHLDDLYDQRFNMDEAVHEDRVADIAGNHVVIRHNDDEFSHLFHLLKGSVKVSVGDTVTRDQPIARIGFSGAATTYSHLHYQLMDGAVYLRDNPLPCRFSDVTLVQGNELIHYDEATIDTGDIILQG
ncbi:M23 family metallopeptidase [Candidatus Bathyarchaeota archaeon]|nr:M23 family metallopeptidase [Candidatus Bathyarchaeota archaeon]